MSDIEFLVSNSHCGVNSNMKLVAIVNALQDIEGVHIDNLDSFTSYFKDNNMGIYLMYRQIDIIEKPKFGEKVILTTYPFNTNPISGYRHIFIKDETGRDLIKSISFGAYVNLETAIPSRLPREIVKAVKDGKPDPSMEHLPRKIKYDNAKSKEIKRVLVEKSNIDRYGHLNNAFYVEFAVNAIENTDKYDRIRAEYIKPFMLNDIVVIKVAEKDEEKIILELCSEEDEVNSIIEFSTIK